MDSVTKHVDELHIPRRQRLASQISQRLGIPSSIGPSSILRVGNPPAVIRCVSTSSRGFRLRC
eukprot:scaffold394933_cov139-Cyclotella_meneghiniana.AAC.2